MIIKTKNGYKVISHRTGRSMGEYRTKREAEIRLKQLKRFGAKNG
jgi:hypothetical protein